MCKCAGLSPLNFPTKSDVVGSSESLMRLVDTYRTDLIDLANGVVSGLQFNFTLNGLGTVLQYPYRNLMMISAKDLYDVGRVAYDTNDHYHSLIWFD